VHPLGLLEPVNGSDVGMVQKRQKLRLSLEPGDTFLVSRELLGKNLDSNVPVELPVSGSVDFSIPPAPMGERIS